MALKTKKTKTASHRPPREIVDAGTKPRRAWLAAKLAEISAKPNTEAKIVGIGSYQEVSEWTVTQQEGRLRHRGTCQVCGREQVVDETTGKLVLHGYKRPGYGFVYNECPGMGELPLNVTDALTKKILADVTMQLNGVERALTKAESRVAAANSALYGHDVEIEKGAWADLPKSRKLARGEEYSADELRMQKARQLVWANEWPLTAEASAAKQDRDDTQSAKWKVKSAVDFYTDLLKMKITGTALREEVVV